MSDGLKIYETEDSSEPIAEVYVEHYDHGEYQVRFRVGVQSFDIGPRYDDDKEVDWLKNQFCHALGVYGGSVSKMGTMSGALLALLDRIEIEEDHTLASQRFDIAEKSGLAVEIGEPVSGAMN